MKNNITIRIIGYFAVAMALSFIPETFPEFFGDWKCAGGFYDRNLGRIVGCDVLSSHNSKWHWGYRHFLWCIMCIVLFFTHISIFIGSFFEKNKHENF